LANFKLTISDKKGKSVTKELKDNDANSVVGLQIGNQVEASIVSLEGKMKITGGSDKSGVPMREDFHGGSRKYVLLSKGVGLKKAEKGQRFRKLIRGNTITDEIFQLNCKLDGQLKIDQPTKGDKVSDQEKTEKKKE